MSDMQWNTVLGIPCHAHHGEETVEFQQECPESEINDRKFINGKASTNSETGDGIGQEPAGIWAFLNILD